MPTRRIYALALSLAATLAVILVSCGQPDRLTQPTMQAPRSQLVTLDPSAPMLVGAGEIARCDSTGDEATAALLDTISGTVITLGDNAYPSGSDTDFNNCYDPSWGRQKARTRPSPGDVDYKTSGAPSYYKYFGSAAGDPTKGYYSYDVGTWHVIVLNSTMNKDTGSAQNNWLRADLAANTKQCTLAYWHHPLFYSGNTSNYHASMKPLWDALYQYGAEVILNGHIRNYERFAPQTPDSVADPVYGIREFVVGTGGYNLGSAFGTPRPNSEVRYRGSFGVLALTLNDGSYHWQFVPQAGAAFTDTGTTSCHGAPPTNQPPVANAGGPYTGVEGSAVQFDGSRSSDKDGTPLTYTWTFGDGSTGTGVKPTHAYADNKTYPVSLVVSDAGGASSASSSTTVTVANAPPVIASLPTPTPTPRARSAATFSATFTDAGILDKHTGTFTWGDGGTNAATIAESNGSGTASASHTYAAAGTYNVSLRVVDNNGAAATVTHAVVVGAPNHPPVASVGGPYRGVEGSPVPFNGSASSDPDGDAIKYNWDFGDGTPHDTGVAPAHTYATDARYTVKLVVTDAYGAISTTSQTTATISNAPPIVTSFTGPASAAPGAAVNVSAAFTDPGTRDTHSATFSWGDNSKMSNGKVTESGGTGTVSGSHTYPAKGSYTVRLVLTDNSGAADTARIVIAVGVPATAPVASAGGPYSGLEAQTLTFNGGNSTSPSGSALSYDWDFGDSSPHATGATPTHSYAKIGTYTVTLVVTDATGAKSQPAQSVAKIADAPPVVAVGLDTTVLTSGAKQLSATFSDPGASDGPWRYDINWGDGSAVVAGSQSTTPGSIASTHTYATAGTYTLRVSVTDAYGAIGSSQAVVTAVSTPVLFTYHVGSPVSGFTTTGRLTSAWYHDASGVLHVAGSGVVRDAAYVRSNDGTLRQTVLLEGQSTNLYAQSEPTLAQVGAGCSAGVTDGTAAAFAAYGFANTRGLHFAAAAQPDNCYPPVTIGAGTQYSISAYVIMDDGSAPVLGASASSGDFSLVVDNTIVSANLKVVDIAGALYRVSGTYRSVGASANDGIARAATQSGKGFTVVGFDLEPAAHATSYIATTGAPYTRNLDQFHAPVTFTPQVLTVCARFVELGAAYESGTFLQIGSRSSTQNPRMIIIGNTTSPYRTKYTDPNGAGGTAGFPNPMPQIGDIVELRGVVRLVNGAPVAYIGQSINGGTETVSPYSAGASALGSAWVESLIDWTAGQAREKGIISTGVLAGEMSMADCRQLIP